jgi:hypothetical protein
MEDVFTPAVLGALAIGGLGCAGWLVICVWLARRASRAMDADMGRARLLLMAYGTLPTVAKEWRRPEISELIIRANQNLGRVHGVRRRHYEARMGELHVLAAQAGMDWPHPPDRMQPPLREGQDPPSPRWNPEQNRVCRAGVGDAGIARTNPALGFRGPMERQRL